jgi:hypothetical protein
MPKQAGFRRSFITPTLAAAAIVGIGAIALSSTPASAYDGEYGRYCYYHRYDPACWRYWHRDYDEDYYEHHHHHHDHDYDHEHHDHDHDHEHHDHDHDHHDHDHDHHHDHDHSDRGNGQKQI